MSTPRHCLLYFLVWILLKDCSSTFIDHPSTGSALTNAPTTLECNVHDEHPLPAAITWYKDGIEKASDERILISYNSSTGYSTYRILNVLYADQGVYYCIAYNAFDGFLFQSNNGTLTVQGRPAFDPPLKAKTAETGSTVTLDSHVVSNPAASITWTLDNEALSASSKVSISGDTVTITNVQSTDSGLYKCTASNNYGTNSTSAKLTVQTVSHPEVYIQQKPLNNQPYSVLEGDQVTLLCTVEGQGISNIQWKNLDTNTPITEGVSISSNSATLSYKSITDSDEGQYQCSANTSTGGYDSQSITINVGKLPVIQLSFYVVTTTENVLLQVSDYPICIITGGDGNITIEWLDNDDNSVPNVNPEMGLQPGNVSQLTAQLFMSASNNGEKYTCKATNAAGSVSESFQLDVQHTPVFSITFENVEANEGDDYSITCEPDANPAATLEWTYNFDVLIPTEHTISGNVLNLYGLSSSSSGQYICTATNSVGIGSYTVFLSVTALPSITSTIPIGDFDAELGEQLSYFCFTSGPADYDVKLYHNGVEVVDRDGLDIDIQFGTVSLTITSVALSDAGEYKCVTTYQNHTTSQAQIMSVTVAPEINSQPIDLNVTLGETPLLPCTATGIPTPEITWRRTSIEFNNALIPVEDDGDLFRYETKGLRLLNPEHTQTGEYTCIASNNVGQDAVASSTVRIEGEPSISGISPTYFIAGDTATLSCELIYNYPVSTISWSQGDHSLLLDPQRFTIHSNGDLVISPVIPEDQQSITCNATNIHGTSSVTVQLEVDVKPIVSFPYDSISVLLNTNLTVTCSVFSRPSSTPEVILPSGNKALSFQFDQTTGVLDISKLTPTLAGTYTCIGTNNLGSGNATITVSLYGAPPINLTASSETSTTATVSWLKPLGDLGDSLLQYQFRYWRIGSTSINEILEDGTSAATSISVTLTGLDEYTQYEFEVRGLYEEGIVSEYVRSTIITLQDVPSSAPRNVSLTALVEALQVNWEHPETDQQNGVIKGYNMWYRTTRPVNTSNGTERPFNETYELIIHYLVPPTEGENGSISEDVLQYNITGLSGGITYDVVLQAFTVIGLGPASDIVSAEVKKPFPLTTVLASVVPVSTVIIAVLVALLVIGFYFCIKRLRKMRKFKLQVAEEARRRKAKKKRKMEISDPNPDVPPDIDMGKRSKFSLRHADGTTVSSHPKVIKPSDVAKKRKSGAQIVSKKDSVMSDPYEDPDAVIPVSRRRKGSKGEHIRDGFAPRDSGGSELYEEPQTSKRKKPEKPPPYQSRHNDDDDDDVPDEVPVAFDWGSSQHDEEDDYPEEPRVTLRNKKKNVSRATLTSVREESEEEDSEEESEEDSEEESSEEDTPPRRSRKRSDQEDLYATVSDKHKSMKRSKMIEQKMKEKEKAKKEKEKMIAKKRKEQEKMQKKKAAEQKKEMKKQQKEQKRRESLGLGNIMDMNEFGRPRGGRRASEISSASLF